MRLITLFLFFLLGLTCKAQLPEGFVYVEDVVKDIEIDLRYFSDNNFIGDHINGYNNNCLILTEKAAHALLKVQTELKKQNLCLKIYDGYRPQISVNHFVKWAKDLNDTINKSNFYPNVKKKNLFKEEYIAHRSGHTRGSTVDLTIIDCGTKAELDMGSPFDFFGVKSWVNYKALSKEQSKNRQLLQSVMLKHNFRNYFKEWWHFTLRNEPFPKTYFNFPIN